MDGYRVEDWDVMKDMREEVPMRAYTYWGGLVLSCN